MSVGIERRHSVDSDSSWGNNGGGSQADVGPSSPFTPMAAQHGGNGGGGTADMTPEAGGSGRNLMARASSMGRAGSAGRPSSAERAGRGGSAGRDWSLSPSSASGRGSSPLKSPAARGSRAGAALTGRRMLYLVIGGFITLATVSMLLAPSRSSSSMSLTPAAGSKHVSADSMVQPQGVSTGADQWRPPDRVVSRR